MKTKAVFIIMMIAAVVTTAQKNEMSEIIVKPPLYNGLESQSIYDFLSSAIQYPEELGTKVVEGTEIIEFVVNKHGRLFRFKVVNSLSPEIDREVIRVLKQTSGRWIPGMVNGEPVEMTHEISVIFKYSALTNFVELARRQLAKGHEKFFVENRPEKALKYYDKALQYLPNEEQILASRSLCRYRLGDKPGAEHDLTRLKVIAERNGNPLGNIRLAENADSLIHLLTGLYVPGY